MRETENMIKRFLINMYEHLGFCYHKWHYFIDEDALIHPSTRICTKCYDVEIFHDGRSACCRTGFNATGWKVLSDNGEESK